MSARARRFDPSSNRVSKSGPTSPHDEHVSNADDVFSDGEDAAEAPMWGRNEEASAETFTNDSETVRVDRADDVVHGDQLAGHYGGKSGEGDVEHGYGNEPHAVRADASTPRRGSKRR